MRRNKLCKHCGNSYIDNTRPGNKVACSRECGDVLRKARQRIQYRKENPTPILIGRKEALRRASIRRSARMRQLPDTLSHKQLSKINKQFRSSCALTGDIDNIHLDHVIPVSSGHGGSIYENIIPLRGDLNISKSDNSIFNWFAENRERFRLEQRKFDELIAYLADINEMSVGEYEVYVRWCHDNPRDLTQVDGDSEDTCA